MDQLGWSGWRRDMCFSTGQHTYRRFFIVRTGDGYTIADKTVGDLARVKTFASAKAWAGIRVGEKSVRHGQ